MIVGGLLTPIEDLMTTILEWFHSSVGLSWSWSIVALVVCVRMLLVPVTVRQIHSMQNLQAHMPEMKEIQKRWKHDRQRQNEELMRFYKENKINPASSCLPIVLQIPIFISLFYVLKDFEKEIFPLYPESTLDWLGLVSIVEPTKDGWGPLLLVIYVISQLSSSYFMAATMQKAQRILLMVLPIVFIPFIIQFPTGLMIYWLTTNLWTTGQGLVTRRLMPKPDLKLGSAKPKAAAVTNAKPKGSTPPEPSSAAKAKTKSPPATGGARPAVAGPPRRVRRKRGGGRRR
jgi:YidC/Oxa1 family membrane protein insertase